LALREKRGQAAVRESASQFSGDGCEVGRGGGERQGGEGRESPEGDDGGPRDPNPEEARDSDHLRSSA
jgi:hypothetical protein